MKTIAPKRPAVALSLYRPLVEKVIGALGALITHQIAYLLVSLLGLRFTSLSDHAHLTTQWAIVGPMAIGAASSFVIWQLRGLGFRSAMSVRYLSALVAALFVVQETIEGLASGTSLIGVASHPAVILGVLISPLIAWLLSRFMAGVTELVAQLLASRPFITPVDRVRPIPVPVRCTPAVRGGQSRPRAPPSAHRY